MTEENLARPCPYCGHHTLFRSEGDAVGLWPVRCANPFCDSNHPPPLESEPEPGSHEDFEQRLRQLQAEITALRSEMEAYHRDVITSFFRLAGGPPSGSDDPEPRSPRE